MDQRTGEEAATVGFRRVTRAEAEALLAEHRRLVYVVARKYAGFLGLDEALQVARIAFVNALDRYDPERGAFGSFIAFAMRAKLHEAILYEQRREAVSLDEPNAKGDALIETLHGNLPGPDAVLESKERKQALRAAIDRLPPRLQSIIWMRYAVELTLDQVGEEHGLTKERIRQLQGEAIEALKEIVAQGVDLDMCQNRS